MDFKSLHQQTQPLFIGNVWDALSARLFEKLNFKAIATSSAAIAHMLGYEDGQRITFTELEYVVKRILSATSLLLSVDMESGYSKDISVIISHVERLRRLGVVGINIEDSLMSQERLLVSAETFQNTVYEIKKYLDKRKMQMFLNVRTDTFLLGIPDVLEKTLKRISLYEKAGADGIFIPGIESEHDIATVVSSTPLPVHVMCMPKLPNFEILQKLGVKRISMGNYLQQSIYDQMETSIAAITHHQSFQPIF